MLLPIQDGDARRDVSHGSSPAREVRFIALRQGECGAGDGKNAQIRLMQQGNDGEFKRKEGSSRQMHGHWEMRLKV